MKAFVLLHISLALLTLPAFGTIVPTAPPVATASSEARIVTGITIINTQGMSFGAIVKTPTGGLVTLDPQGTRTASGGAILASSNAVSPAAFLTTGESGYTYAVMLPQSMILVRHRGNSNKTMIVDNFQTLPSYYLLLNGQQSFTVGATLHVGPHQAPGTYTGSFDVTAAYN